MIIGLITAAVLVGADQLTKFLVYGTATRSIIGNFLWFSSTLNTGVAFSLFENATIFFAVLSALASVLFCYLIFSKKFMATKLKKFSLGLLLGGTFSNFLDRVIFGGVRDFIYLKFINYAIFNVADMGVVCGVIIICVTLVVELIKDAKSAKNAKSIQKNEKTGAKTDNFEENSAENPSESNAKNGE